MTTNNPASKMIKAAKDNNNHAKTTNKSNSLQAMAALQQKILDDLKDSNSKDTSSIEDKTNKKHPGGRIPHAEKGLKTRKQYTLTLKEEDYLLFYERAQKEGLSFAKFLEKSAFEYLENHKEH